jgi:hypothetical protein
MAPGSFTPLAATAGALWTISGLTTAATNTDHNKVNYGAAALNTVAGGTQLASAFLSGDQYIPVAATSSAAWAVNALTNLAKTGQAVYDGQGSTLANAAQASGALLNLGAALAAGASSYYTTVGNPAAVPSGFASGLLWGAGALAQGTGTWLDQRPSAEKRPSDLEANQPAKQAASQSTMASSAQVSHEPNLPGPMPGTFA